MEIKDLLLGTENSLPTLEGNLSSSTANPAMPVVTASASSWWKFGASTVIGLLGMLFLSMGKKQKNVDQMILGAVLTLASFFMF
jgi:ABC-type uncharacterized transport system permease subunit